MVLNRPIHDRLSERRIIAFIVVIAATVQLTELYLSATSPLLHQVLGIYLPLITSNCAVLGVTLLALQQSLTFAQTIIFAIGAALDFDEAIRANFLVGKLNIIPLA